jgi:predicted RNase H-like HicB family nuclease
VIVYPLGLLAEFVRICGTSLVDTALCECSSISQRPAVPYPERHDRGVGWRSQSSALWLRPFSITPPAPPSTGDCFVASLASALLPPSAAYWTGKMAQHHVVVLVPQSGGGWRAHFPDFPGCRAEAARVESTIDTSMRAVAEMIDNMHREGAIIPQPRSYEEVRADDAWAVDRGIDWSTAVISLVRV